MAKMCEQCGNKVGFTETPLFLDNDKVLCNKCSSSIKDNVDKLYSTKSEAEFNRYKNETLCICKDSFNESTCKKVQTLIQRIQDRKEFSSSQPIETQNENVNSTSKNPDIQEEQLKCLKNIEGMIKFFVVLTVISICISVISSFVLMSNF